MHKALVFKQEKVKCIKQVKLLRKPKKKIEKYLRDIPDLKNFEHLKIVVYSDISFTNLTEKGSQRGYICFLVGSNSKYIPIARQSNHIRRVVKRTLVDETLAMVNILEICWFYQQLWVEQLQLKDETENIKIRCKTDNTLLYDSVYSSIQILNKRLHIEMPIWREMIDKKEFAEIFWVPTNAQITNS